MKKSTFMPLNLTEPPKTAEDIGPAALKALADLYCPDEALRKDPYCSPYFADYTGMPPMLLAWDKTETLAPDNEILAEKLQEKGIEMQYKSYEGCCRRSEIRKIIKNPASIKKLFIL